MANIIILVYLLLYTIFVIFVTQCFCAAVSLSLHTVLCWGHRFFCIFEMRVKLYAIWFLVPQGTKLCLLHVTAQHSVLKAILHCNTHLMMGPRCSISCRISPSFNLHLTGTFPFTFLSST